jgi:hypothetical protein
MEVEVEVMAAAWAVAEVMVAWVAEVTDGDGEAEVKEAIMEGDMEEEDTLYIIMMIIIIITILTIYLRTSTLLIINYFNVAISNKQ